MEATPEEHVFFFFYCSEGKNSSKVPPPPHPTPSALKTPVRKDDEILHFSDVATALLELKPKIETKILFLFSSPTGGVLEIPGQARFVTIVLI